MINKKTRYFYNRYKKDKFYIYLAQKEIKSIDKIVFDID